MKAIALNNLGLVRLDQKKSAFLEEARAAFLEAIGLEPEIPEVWMNLIRAVHYLGEAESVEVYFLKPPKRE